MGAFRRLVSVMAAVCIVASSRAAVAAPPWVDRPLTMPRGDWQFDFGLGIAHEPAESLPEPARGLVPFPDDWAAGINAEMKIGLTNRVELGVRTGVRFGDGHERGFHGDGYGRLFDRHTFSTGADVLANPELRVRGALVRGEVAEVALEGRVVLPIEGNTRAGLMFGVPLAFHLGDRVRLDTGVYVPVVFTDPQAYFALRFPLDVWIQVTHRLWLGPMTGLVFERTQYDRSVTSVSMGFGLGYQITRAVDFKAILLFPAPNSDSRVFGVGAGVAIRIE